MNFMHAIGQVDIIAEKIIDLRDATTNPTSSAYDMRRIGDEIRELAGPQNARAAEDVIDETVWRERRKNQDMDPGYSI